MHVVVFDNPWPPDYGGVIDVFNKIDYLSREGVRITLHSFTYGRKPGNQLENLCEKVFYYPRKTVVNPFSPLPYIVASRNHPELLKNLLTNNAPILFEGIHTCYLLNHPALRNRIKMVRMHNIEHDYYRQAGRLENNIVKRLYFNVESARLTEYERVLENARAILAISEHDYNALKPRFPQTELTGPFHSNEKVTSLPGKGDYALYHAKLSVTENDRSARWLAGEVFSKTDYPLIIAGHHPSERLRKIAGKSGNITITDNPSHDEIARLIRNAHINVLPAFQTSGIKLKLLNALYAGRFVVANSFMADGTGCEQLCEIAETPEEFLEKIESLRNCAFSTDDIELRSEVLNRLFNNSEMARHIIRIAGL
jgi:glycosyltransferase involved in cell wall biosynthesis